ncbi:histone-lysine N-methyltransferase SETDB2 [Gouania willdenowi]|uniref:Histone-lysine N-methyltransferase SETDB2 n=1 Tax=Gouania willdenowi TaxID=441366 RepID=A0A8C5G0G3_GOUWI|nr:histone-lysine N-methyltransferase SETDB2-like [Gouania willdenowi]
MDSGLQTEVERAKAFWSEEDVDSVFEGILVYLHHLKKNLKENTATDREFLQAFRLLECLNCSPSEQNQNQDQNKNQDSSVLQVVIGAEELLPVDAPPPAEKEELIPPLSPTNVTFDTHTCSQACLQLPTIPVSYSGNPLKLPLQTGFLRIQATPNTAKEPALCDVMYRAPCGRSLRNHTEVMEYLLATESYAVLQADDFCFNAAVRIDPPALIGPEDQDLSRGAEPVQVQLIGCSGGERPADFRYRRGRWPHGCFLSRGPALFSTCCDCTDGCSDATRCACVAMTTEGRHYLHQRLLQPVDSGLYECGPWCGCDRTRCQNRLVQRGLRVRLQVFLTDNRGWGVRCRDDLDAGTFICIYAGVVLCRVPTPADPPPPKLTRSDLPSDDEVEVVTEWLAPPLLEGRSQLLDVPPTSPSLHVPVIQRSADPADQDQIQAVLVGSPEKTPAAPSLSKQQQKQQEEELHTNKSRPPIGHSVSADPPQLQQQPLTVTKKRPKTMDNDVCYIDASREGNVSRFINHSCQPNLFIQNVFTDSHDPAFPVLAFFTNRSVPAGSELTANFSSDCDVMTSSHEVTCLCRSSSCRGQLFIQEMLRDGCEVESHAH